MRGQIFIPKPSPITISMGKVTQNVYSGSTFVGLATIANLTLVPGDNLVEMSSASDQAAVIQLIISKYADATIPVTITGNSSSVDGVDMPYFTAALRQQVLQTTLVLGPALKKAGIDPASLTGGGSSSGSSSSVASAPASSATVAPVSSAALVSSAAPAKVVTPA